MKIIIGNIVALVASCIMVYSGYLKKKDKILLVEIIHNFLFALSNFILGGITGSIVNLICISRNYLCYTEKLSNMAKVILLSLTLVLSVLFNRIGIIGYFPVISFTIYTLFINTKNIIRFKILIIFIMTLWVLHDIYIKSYVSAGFDLMCIISNTVALIQIKIRSIKND